jgi:hypothetical protein
VKGTHLEKSPDDTNGQQEKQGQSEIQGKSLVKYVFAFGLSNFSIRWLSPH